MTDDGKKLTVDDDMVVSMQYALHLGDGEIVDHSAKDEPLKFMQGHDQIIPGLEGELYGMGIGDKKRVVVEPEQAYGKKDPEAIQAFPRDAFPPDVDLTEGMRFRMRDKAGDTFSAYVDEVRDEEVVLNFNHPLAGETLHFDVEIVDLRAATSEELEHGHVH
jgi:FKBP-type peptidyl-prolyl cis-trans isomerase SlyD